MTPQLNKIEEAKIIGGFLVEIAKEVTDIISNAEKEVDDYAIGFLQYVENTYTKQGDQYYMKIHGLTHVHRSIEEVIYNYKYFLKRNESA